MGKGLPRSRARGEPARNPIVKQFVEVSAIAISVAGTTGVGWGTAVIGDLPEGNILFLGAIAYLQFNSADADITATYDGDYSIGTAATADATLADAEVDIVPSTALGAATAKLSPRVRGANATQVMLDNTDGSLELNLNLLIDDATISGTADMTATGFVQLAYIVLGDD